MQTNQSHLLGLAMLAAISFGLTACGSSDPGVVECSSGDCMCEAQACACTDDCNTECVVGSCSFRCESRARCEVTQAGEGIASLFCSDSSVCKAHGVQDGASIECSEQSDCDFKADGPASAVCSDDAVCKIEVGEGGMVQCFDNADCDIKCVGSACDIVCAETATCDVTCGDDQAATACSGGVLSCGECP